MSTDDPRTREQLLAEIASLRRQLARPRPTAGDSEELRLILDATPALVAYIDARETYTLVNRAYEAWFDLPRGAILGRTVRDVLGHAAYEVVRPHIAAALAGDRVTFAAELDYPHGRRCVEASYAPHIAPDGAVAGFVALVLDVSDASRDREHLRFLARASRTLGASLDLGATLQSVTRLAVPQLGTWCSIYLLGADGQTIDLVAVSHADPARADLIRDIHRRYPPLRRGERGLAQILRDGQTRFIPHVDPAANRSAFTDDAHHALITSLGATSWLLVPLAIHGRLFGAISLGLADPTRRYQSADVATIEELARRASAALDNARLFAVADRERARAEDANRAKDLFLSTLSHELRTPLTAILGWTRLLRTPGLPDDRKDRGLETIERNARAQVAIIEDILDISRIVTGKLRLELRTVDLVPLALAALDTVRPTADARGLSLHADLGPAPPAVRGDPERLQQVVWNLLTNAVKFTPRGGAVTLALTADDAAVELCVRDTGQGIDPDFLPHVFDRFSQSDASTTRAHGGLGLGLAIVRHLVELHGGSVDATSDGPGRGACFRVRLPHLPQDPPVRPPAPAEPAPLALAATPDLTGLHVLVVVDDPDTRDLVVGALEHCHAAVTAVATVAEALALFLRGPPSVVVSDMPGEDGDSLIRTIRGLPPDEGGRVPTIALTAHARVEDRTRALVAGFDRHVSKPIEPTELLVTLANLCGRSPHA